MATFRAGFDASTWARLETRGDLVSLSAGNLVLRRGEPPTCVFIVQSGTFEVVDSRTSPETVLAHFGPGDVFGEMSFLEGAPVSADVRAAGPAECLRFPVARLSDALARDPGLDAAFSRSLAVTLTRRAREVTRSAMTGALGPAREATAQPAVQRNVGGALLAAVKPLPPRALTIALEVLARRSERSSESIEQGIRGGMKTLGQTIRERAWEETDLAALLGALMKGLATTISTAAGTADALVSVGVDPVTAAAAVAPKKPFKPMTLKGDRVRIGFWKGCELTLPDPRIAPIHAELIRTREGWRVVSAGDRAVVIGDASVTSAPLPENVPVRVGGYTLHREGDTLHIASPAPPFALHARELVRSVGAKVLLDEVSFTALAGEVIAVIGPSGAGKTTLLHALKGLRDGGAVTLDGTDFAELLGRTPTLAGEVPQDDIVLPELTVEESLLSACRLRLPHESRQAHRGRVDRVLDVLGLSHIRHQRIGDPEQRGISGGQRKRVNIAQEVLSDDTRILFLDEPTSGLDPRSASDIARLARRIADQGRILFIVTHDLTPALLSQVDQLLVLAPGGRLAFFGPVDEANRHFRVSEPAEIFDRLPEKSPTEWASAYSDSKVGSTWQAVRQAYIPTLIEAPPLPEPTPGPSWPAQLLALTRRYATVKLRDRTSLAVLAAQPAAVAAIMVLVFPEPTAALFFLLTLSCLWFGMSASVRELISDGIVWRRESALGLATSAWVGAKALVLGALVAVQCGSLAALVGWLANDPGLGFSAASLVGSSVLTGWVGVSIGLLVSAMWRKSEAAVGTIVLLLVPQIAFSGVLLPLDKMTETAQWLATVTPLRYAFHLTLRCGDKLAYLSRKGEWQARPVRGDLGIMGLRPDGAEAMGMDPSTLAVALAGFGLAALVSAVIVLRARR
ncbi:MAG: ATP-binding cassette domain-containing protein [Proteobacteria bacterium]|nr:ATP-binding cassette domain-containing protein [Pseudomonadota bacterium]